MKSRKHIAALLKMARIRRGYSQALVADALGFTCSQIISNWEREESSPADEHLHILCDLFTLPPKAMRAAMLADREVELFRAGI